MAGKRTISARELVTDIRVGKTDEQLMAKHMLSAGGLESLKNKLLAAGLVTQAQLDGRGGPVEESDPTPVVVKPKEQDTEPRKAKKCPNCKMPQEKGFEICPQCGVIVGKYLGKIESEEPKKKKRSLLVRVVVWIAACIGGFLLFLFILGLLAGPKEKTTAAKIDDSPKVSTTETASESHQVAPVSSSSESQEIPFPVPPISDRESAREVLDKVIRFRWITEGGRNGESLLPYEQTQVDMLQKEILGSPPPNEGRLLDVLWKEYNCSCKHKKYGVEIMPNAGPNALDRYVLEIIRSGPVGARPQNKHQKSWDRNIQLDRNWSQEELDRTLEEYSKNRCQGCVAAVKQLKQFIDDSLQRAMKEKENYMQLVQERATRIAKAQAAIEEQKRKEREAAGREAKAERDRRLAQLPTDAQHIDLVTAINGPGTAYIGKSVMFEFICQEIGQDRGGYYIVLGTHHTGIPAAVVYFDPSSCGNITTGSRVAAACIYQGKARDITVYLANRIVVLE